MRNVSNFEEWEGTEIELIYNPELNEWVNATNPFGGSWEDLTLSVQCGGELETWQDYGITFEVFGCTGTIQPMPHPQIDIGDCDPFTLISETITVDGLGDCCDIPDNCGLLNTSSFYWEIVEA